MLRVRSTRILTAISALAVAATAANHAAADHHLMQIEQVIGGVNGDPSAQAIQLRMRAFFQNNMTAGRLRVFDANGQNPVLLIDFADTVPNFETGDRVLVTTAAFNAQTTPPCEPDFTMTNRIPDSYLAAGSLIFQSDTGIIWWRLSWGGAGYTGSNSGNIQNDDDGNFGPPWPGPLPSDGAQALQFQGGPSDLSTSNAADYELTAGPATFTNNARESFVVNEGGKSVPATLTDVSLPFGTVISGGLQELINSDNTWLRTRSIPGFTAEEANLIEIRVGADTDVQGASTFDLTLEGRLNQPGGTVRVRFRNWSNNAFVQVHQYAIGFTEAVETIEGISAANRVRASDGRIELSLRLSVFATFSALGFDAFTDQVVIGVE